MGLVNVVAPPQIDRSGRVTETSTITWHQRGNVVNVTIYNFPVTDTNAHSLTGLPAPIDYQMCRFINDGGYLGYMESTANGWDIRGYRTSTSIYGSFTYLTDDVT